MTDATENPRCGFVAIVGRPNVGKSTLLNHILGQKLAITSRKPQTTRHNMLGIKTIGAIQTIYVDTPGLHTSEGKALNRQMNKNAQSALKDVDVVIFVIDRLHWTKQDQIIAGRLKNLSRPLLVVINKTDRLDDKSRLISHMAFLATELPNAEILPISALKAEGVAQLEKRVGELLPQTVHLFPNDQITDRSSRFIAAERVREKIMRQLGDELPYQIAVQIEEFKQEGKVLHIHALILVERDGQKKILIGEAGERLKSIGSAARKELEALFESKIMLRLWVKVRSGWSDDERALRSLGYD